MGPRASEDPPELREIELANVPNQGLGYHDKNNKVVLVSDANLQLVGTTFSPKFGLKANVWGVKYNQAKGPKVWRLVVPKDMERYPSQFSLFLDKQSGEDSGFYIRKPALWTKFIHSQEDKLRGSANRVRFTLTECTGLQAQVVDWGDRDSERYVFDYHSMYDSSGKRLSPVDCVFFPLLSTKRDAMPQLKSIKVLPGGREIFADVIRVSTPNNFYPCLLSLAAGVGLFHGQFLRFATAGQLPVLCLKSAQRGKSQGKSGVGRLLCKCFSDWTKNKISYKLKQETIKKRASFTTLPLYFDDVKDDKFLARITEGYDDGETYETNEGEFVRRAEMMFSANYFGMDEDKGTVDGERTLDRIAAVPFGEWSDMSVNDFAAKQNKFKTIVDNPTKPTEFVIGEMGDYLRSEEFKEKRLEFSDLLYQKTDESVKWRTLLTNYASFYAILWKIFTVFQDVWAEDGHSWEGFMEWVENIHAPFLKKQHREKDHAKHSIRRFIHDLFIFIVDWSIVDRRKILKICETSKLKNGQKYCLAFHPNPRYVDFQEMGGVRLKELKMHANNVGGAWGDDTWANLVKETVDAVFDTPEEEAAGLEDGQAKRSVLMPMEVFTSTQIMKMSKMLGQSDDYKKYGADEETPSGVEDVRNSTQATGSSLNLVLTDVSSINAPSIAAASEDEIIFDELQDPEDYVLQDDEEDDDEDLERDDDDEETIDANDEEDEECYEDITAPSFSSTVSTRKVHMKAKSSRNITVLEKPNGTFFICPCGHSSTNKSGSSRHKCKKPMAASFPCGQCDLICRNPGSLKRHINLKHGEGQKRMSMSLPVNLEIPNDSVVTVTSRSQDIPGFPCDVCGKMLKTEKTLAVHLNKVHNRSKSASVPVTSDFPCEDCSEVFTAAQEFKRHVEVNHTKANPSGTIGINESRRSENECAVCGKVLASRKNLDAHMQKIHNGVGEHSTAQQVVLPGPSLQPDVSPANKCSVCGKILASQKNLQVHVKKVHKLVDVPDFSTQPSLSTSTDSLSTQPAEASTPNKVASTLPATSSTQPSGPSRRVKTSARRRSISSHKAKSSAKKN